MSEENNENHDNLEVCPNCLEPNTQDLANCAFCGMPLRAQIGEDGELTDQPETQQLELSDAAHTEAPRAQQSPKEEKKKGMWATAKRGIGLYLIIYAVMEFPRALKIESSRDRTLAIISNLIYIAAGLLMSWPMIKEYLDKRKGKTDANQDAAEDSAAVIDGVSKDVVDEGPEDVIDGEAQDIIEGEIHNLPAETELPAESESAGEIDEPADSNHA